MKKQQSESSFKLRRSVLMTASALGLTAALPAAPTLAQPTQPSFVLEEVVVTARRREERLQDVPVSMTVMNQDSMHNNNIVNAADIATYTPSLQTNSRFGSDSTNFAIRGFSQELRTTASVGVYFAETVAPRGANTTQSGDGAGPGDFFDLENVQVLKGPQGTLFGRNTTGGAVLLTPKKPTDELEGYVEGSIGNYDMQRIQGVINVPVADNFRMRFGVDHQKRDGYMKNISDIGPSDFENTDYTSFRASAVWDITDTLENYTIVKYSESETNGSPYSLFDCNPNAPLFGAMCQADLNRRNAEGKNGHFDVYNFVDDSHSELETWQVINTTTWDISDNLTLKNIISYGEVESRQNFALYGTNWNLGDAGLPIPNLPFPYQFQMVGSTSAIPTTDQKTFTEEFQLQGTAFEDRLTWQAGLYYEKSKPNGTYGSYNPTQISCDPSTISGAPENLVCIDPIGMGSYLQAPGGVTYENKAVYAQGTWEFNNQWSATAGVRYTRDETEGWTEETVYYFDGREDYTERRDPKTASEEPTWLIGVDYRPMDDVLLYGKYSRGYRQGSVNLASVGEWATHGPEQVDTYEIGAKTAFYGRFPGTFNVALFYNDFEDQQIQFGYFRDIGLGTTSILNAGKSEIWGVEIDGNVFLTENLSLAASYAYLDTEVKELNIPSPADYPAGISTDRELNVSTFEGQPLSYTPKHQLVLTATYRVPIDEQIGDMSLAATYVYNDEMQGVGRNPLSPNPNAVLPSYEIVNLNFNWKYVMGSQFDVSMFITNATNEKYRTYVTGNYGDGFEYGRVGQPRMYGARVRYNF